MFYLKEKKKIIVLKANNLFILLIKVLIEKIYSILFKKRKNLYKKN